MPSLDNWIDLPREIIEQIHDKHCGNQAWEKEAQEYFSSRLSSSKAWDSIVCLNECHIKNVKNGQLVRFRGMVQDQLGPEMFASGAVIKNNATSSQKIVTGKFKDEIILEADEEVVTWNATESRQCYYCVPIPGETPWIKKQVHESNAAQFQSSQPSSVSFVGKKRPLDEDMSEDSVEDNFKKPCPPTAAVGPSAARVQNLENILNFPLPSTDSVGCIVKIYSEEELPLNCEFEFAGIVSFNSPSSSGMETDDAEEFQPPSSVVPRIHCLLSNKWLHNNPNLNSTAQSWNEESLRIISEASVIREEVHRLLTEFFMGDTLAADYLLCHLVSRVYSRKDALALGKLSLNLTNVAVAGEDYTRSLFSLFETLVTKAHYLPMSLQNLNTFRLIPKKDYVENRLVSGRLQLSSNTHLVLDETAMTEGQLNSDGVKNITALGNITSWQKIEYDFNFHPVEFLTDIPVLILSERKSMLACDVHLPLRLSNNETFNPSLLLQRLNDNLPLLTKMRNYLTAVRLAPFNLGDSMQEAVQKDFIQSRAPGQTNPMSTEDFHLLLVLSRLVALTCGQSELTESVWQKAKSMETERKSRLASR